MVSVWPMVVVESDPAADACLGLRPDFPGVEVDAFVFQRPPEAFDEDVAERELEPRFISMSYACGR